ncbi:MAG: ThuA domain-containing protein [Verrucomicrobiota bacterium]
MKIDNQFTAGMRYALLLSLTAVLLAPSPALCLSEAVLAKFNQGFEKQEQVDTTILAQASEIAKRLSLINPPAKPRKVLVYGISHGPHRNSIPTAMAVIDMLGKTTGAFEALCTTELSYFEPEALKKFDAVVFPNTTGDVFVRPLIRDQFKALSADERNRQNQNAERLAQNLADFVSAGGGFFGTHGATDSNKKIPVYVDMIGAAFSGHPWNGGAHVMIRVEEPDHGLIKNIFPGPEFTFKDEIYEFKSFSRDRCRVLLSLNIEKSEEPTKPIKGEHYIPVTWLKNYGDGRVLYQSLGHNRSSWGNEMFLKFMLAGLQYAVGDHPAEDSY